MSPRITVVQSLAPARVGGLESVVASLSEGLSERDHRVHVAAVVEPGIEEHEFLERLSRLSIPVRRLEIPPRAYHREILAIRDLLRELSPDVVHTHGYRGDVVAGSVARFFGFPVVSTVHGFTGGDGKNRFYEWLQRRALRGADAVAAVSEPIRRGLVRAGVDESRVRLLRNAFSPGRDLLSRGDARARLALPADAFVVGWVGRLSREKGADVLVAAAEHMGEDVVCSMMGDGPERDGLERAVRRAGLGDRIRLHGRVPGAGRLFRAFDLFVISSRTEGTPICLFEAMEAEVPVVATRVGGVPDVVRAGEEAVLVPPEDPEALARAVETARRSPGAAGERARKARERLEEEFARGPWVERYARIYREVIDGEG